MIFEFIHCLSSGLDLSQFKTHSGVSPRIKHEWGLLSRRVYVVVVLELGKWQQFLPVILSLVDKQSKILLELLVDMFSLSVAL